MSCRNGHETQIGTRKFAFLEVPGLQKAQSITDVSIKELFIPPAVEQKDVSQVTSLAYVLSELQWLAYCFEYDEVSQDTRDKINQAIALILEAIKDQAELGQKSFAIEDKDLTALSEE